VQDHILRRADGVPLFIEELTKAVLEGGLLDERTDRYVLRGPLPSLAIPDTLQASLMARLDRLPHAREIAQIGAVIGREFPHELLAAITGRGDQDVQFALDRLTESGLIQQRGAPPQVTYLFKHALVQDAAYATLLRSRRIELHARIAGVLEERFPETAETQPERLAHHFSEAGLADPAIAYWMRAGELASRRWANLEAVAHFRRGMAIVDSRNDRADGEEQEFQLLIAFGQALMNTRSTTDPEVADTYARARRLASQIGRPAELFKAVWGSWLTTISRGDMPATQQLIEELFEIAEAQDDTGLLLQAHHAAWTSIVNQGDMAAAQKHAKAGISIYRREFHGQHALTYGGHDPGECAHICSAQANFLLGHADVSRFHVEQAVALARDLGHPPTLGHAYQFGAEVYALLREPRMVEQLLESWLPIIATHSTTISAATAKMLRGWALATRGRGGEGLLELRAGLDAWRATGSRIWEVCRLARAADAYRVAGHASEALSLINDAQEAMERRGGRWFEAELHRIRGKLFVAAGDQSAAEACYHRALAVAREQAFHFFELRAASCLARLWLDQGRRDHARALLAPTYGWFTEGFDTADLIEAKTLLVELC
jgi:predicted ATPase